MIKKILAILAAVPIILCSVETALAEQDYMYWGFSDTADQYNGLSLKANDGTAILEDGVVKISYASGKAPDTHFLINKEYKAIDDIAVIEFDYKTEAESANLYLQNTPSGGSVFRLKQINETTLRATYGAGPDVASNTNTVVKSDLVQGDWYHIQFILDYANKQCSVAIDYVTVLDRVSLFYNNAGLSNAFYDVLIAPDKPGTVYVDNFAVYKPDNKTAFLKVRSELLEIPAVAEDNLVLATELPGGVDVRWLSSDEAIIGTDGMVKFPSMSEGDKTVELSALLTSGSDTYTRKYAVTVPARLTDAEAVELAAKEIAIDEKIYDRYSLPAAALNDVNITWSADKTSLLHIADTAENGAFSVTASRQETDETVTLTAVFTRGSASAQKTYTVILPRLMTDLMSVEEDSRSIKLPEKVKEGFELPTVGINSTSISWVSKDESFIRIQENKAVVLKRDTVDKEITLTAKVEKGAASVEVDITVVVEKDIEGNLLLLQKAVEALELGKTTALTENIALPLSGINDTVISWHSSDEGVISSEGVITRAGSSKAANLTATVTKGTLTQQKVFRVTVAGKSTGGGGSGGRKNDSKSVSIGAGVINKETNKPAENIAAFKDMNNSHWAYRYVERLHSIGVISGDANGCFRPESSITREEFVKMLIKALYGDAAYKEMSAKFNDVEKGKWYTPYINEAYERGFITGISNDNFGVGEPILREQIAVILQRATGATGSADAFNDAPDISEYAVSAVNAMKKSGFICGDELGNFNPKKYATRAETAKIICEITEFVKGAK